MNVREKFAWLGLPNFLIRHREKLGHLCERFQTPAVRDSIGF
jgi:hypothetical protein